MKPNPTALLGIAVVKTTFKDATDHKGRPMAQLAEAAEKSFAAKP